MAALLKFCRDILQWIRNINSWLGQALIAWDTLLGIFFALVIPFLFNTPSEGLRFSGLLLQFIGAIIVIVDINGTRKIFGKPGMLSSANQWLKSFPTFHPQAVTAGATVTLPSLSVSGRGYTYTDFDSNASLTDRVAEIERVVWELQHVHEQVDRRIDEVKGELSQEIAIERQERVESEDKTHQLLKQSQTDGLHISALGAIWLLVGMILSTVPSEITTGTHWLWSSINP